MSANEQRSELRLDLSSAAFAQLEDIKLIFFHDAAIFEQINGSATISDFLGLDVPVSSVDVNLELKEDGEFHVKQTPIVFYLGWRINSARTLEFDLQSTDLKRDLGASTQSMKYTLTYFNNDVKCDYESGSEWSKISAIKYGKGTGEQKGAIAISFVPEDNPDNREILLGPYDERVFSGNVLVRVRPIG